MLAIAPHKRGAVFLPTVDKNTDRAQNASKQGIPAFEERMGDGSFQFKKTTEKIPANWTYSNQPLASPEIASKRAAAKDAIHTERPPCFTFLQEMCKLEKPAGCRRS